MGEGNTGFILFVHRPYTLEPFPYEELLSLLGQRGCRLVGHAAWPVSNESDTHRTLVGLLESAAPEHVEADCLAVWDFVARIAAARSASPTSS
jgi:hypothetical protein